MAVRVALLLLICATGLAFATLWAGRVLRARAIDSNEARRPNLVLVVIGFVTNFFDTLGIGSFATTTAAFKALRLVPDEDIPGTMIAGHALPVVIQALIFIAVVSVDSTVLLTLIAATVMGGWLGAGVVTRLPRRPIQIGMGVGLLLAATFMAMSQLGLFPGGGTALGLSSGKLLIATAIILVLGALVMVGIGHYAPCLIMLSLLGMDPRAAFPIMMGAGAMVAMIGGFRFIDKGRYNVRAALGLTIGGIPGVLIAGLVVKSLPLDVLRWVVVAVVTYAALTMLRSGLTTPTEGSIPRFGSVRKDSRARRKVGRS
ncbi:MAG: sulfite exporter TauE/SafE family protein [Vicinamibacteria bacterium]